MTGDELIGSRSIPQRARLIFLLLIVAQAAHSVEEIFGRLYDVFAPARWVSGLVSQNLELGFVVGNIVLVAFGVWSWWRGSRRLAWFWTVLELGNGVVHTVMAVRTGGYWPGLGTAPVLVGLAGWLGVLLLAADERRLES